MPFSNAHIDDPPPTDRKIGLANMKCIAVYNEDAISHASGGGGGDRFEEEKQSSSSSSSIGKNSTDEEGNEEEVQSKHRGGAFDNLHELEKALPIKRSISQFYSGKSKSFTSLRKVESCTTIQDIVKPENACSRKRKNLLAYQCSWENDFPFNGGMIKRHMNSRGTWTHVPMKSCHTLNSNLQPCGPSCFPPLPPSFNNIDISSRPLELKIPSLFRSSSSDLEDM